VDLNQTIHQRPLGAGQIATCFQVVSQRPVFIARPGPEGVDELVLVDQTILESDEAEEQVAIGGDCGHGTSLQASEAARLRSIPGDGSPRAAVAPHRTDFLTTDHPGQPTPLRDARHRARRLGPFDRIVAEREQALRRKFPADMMTKYRFESSGHEIRLRAVAPSPTAKQSEALASALRPGPRDEWDGFRIERYFTPHGLIRISNPDEHLEAGQANWTVQPDSLDALDDFVAALAGIGFPLRSLELYASPDSLQTEAMARLERLTPGKDAMRR
jgi:hypothetical protein